MATIDVDVKEAVWYDPDGPNAPLTLRFPLSSTVPDGSRIKLHNRTTSSTPVTLLAQDDDVIADPQEIASFAASQVLTMPEIILEYMLVVKQWRLSGQGDPDLAKNALDIFALAAYGGLYLDTAPVVGTDLGAGWTTITAFDTVKYATPRGIVQNLANNSLSFTIPGTYLMPLIVSFEHIEAQQGRTIYLRLYNLTDAVPIGTGIPIFIARNQPGTTQGIPYPLVISAAGINKEIQLQIGGGDIVTGVSYAGLDWSFHSIGEYQGTL